MVEFILIFAIVNGPQAVPIAVTTVPFPFYSEGECRAAGQKAVGDFALDAKFSCVRRTPKPY